MVGVGAGDPRGRQVGAASASVNSSPRGEAVFRLLEVYSRIRDPRETLAVNGLARTTVRALRHNPAERTAVLTGVGSAVRELAQNRGEAKRLLA